MLKRRRISCNYCGVVVYPKNLSYLTSCSYCGYDKIDIRDELLQNYYEEEVKEITQKEEIDYSQFFSQGEGYEGD